MANREIEAILRISSKLGNMRALATLRKELKGVENQAKAFNRAQAAIGPTARNAALMATRYLAPAVLAAGAVSSTKAYATLERRMERIGITAGASAKETEQAFGRLKTIAQDLGTPVENVIEGMESLVASGKSMDEAFALLPSVAATAHAADAAFSDMATTADAVANSFGIASGEMEKAFDILAAGGKAGKFELKDMAAQLPSLAPAFAALGYKGEAGLKKLVAALQTVRLETGMSSEAATSFMDVLTKMESTATASNFAKFGIDIRKEMEKARKAGEDTLDAFIRLSEQAVKGDMSKLPQLFTDKQMLIGMRALMNHTKDTAEFMRQLGDAAGTVRGDLNRLADDAQGAFDRIGNSWQGLQAAIGKSIVSSGLLEAMDAVTAKIERTDAIVRGQKAAGETSWWKRAILANYGTQSYQNQMAYLGGYRTPLQRAQIEGYGAYARSRNDAAARPAMTPVPGVRPSAPAAPLPMPRPQAPVPPALSRSQALQYQTYGESRRAAVAPPAGSGDANFDEFTRAIGMIEQAGGKAGQDVAQGGQDAANRIAEGGAQAGQKFADTAGGSLQSLAQSAGAAFGEAAAARIREAGRSLSQITAGSRAGAVSGNMGVSGAGGAR